MRRFREFVRLSEEEAAPVPSAGPPPTPGSSGSTTNKYHFDAMQRELGIDDKAFKGAIEGGIQTLYKVPDYGWGFRVQPPVQATIKDKGNGQYDVTFMLAQKKLMNPKSFLQPYQQGQRPNYYEGPVEDKTEPMNQEELADLLAPAYQGAGMGGGMGGAPPIGMPGMPAGGPPMAPPAGGM
jgi:hypothetical protein